MSIAALVALSESARAQLTVGPSSTTIRYSLDYTGGAGTVPVFDTSPSSPTFGQLLTPGAGFPVLIGPTVGNPIQTFTGSLASPIVYSSVTGGSGNTVPPPFGTATTALYNLGSGSQGLATTQGGIFWDTRTSLVDNLAGISAGLASVSYSRATTTFFNNTLSAIAINPGALLSVRGTVGGSGGSYVAAGLASSYTLTSTTGTTNVTNAGIVMAANANGQTVNQTGNVPGNATSISYFNNQLFASATSFFGAQPVLVGVGQSITIDATLTLITDPGSSLQIVSDLAPGFPSGATIPDFGAFAGGTVFNAVPEPSTIVMLGLGLASAGAWRVRSGGRRSARP